MKSFEKARDEAINILSTEYSITIQKDSVLPTVHSDTVLNWFDVNDLLNLNKIGLWFKLHKNTNCHQSDQINSSLHNLFGI